VSATNNLVGVVFADSELCCVTVCIHRGDSTLAIDRSDSVFYLKPTTPARWVVGQHSAGTLAAAAAGCA
jgi:hypothetical protein